jgi:protein-disulfide isomerase
MSSRAEQTEVAAQRKRAGYLAGGISLIALIVVVALVLVSQAGEERSDVDVDALFGGIEQDGIALGDADATVTVVEFADLQCPFCADFATEDLPTIVEDYVRPGDVRMELRLLAFIGEDSERGALVAAAAAEQDRIWPFSENVFANQGAENSGFMTTDFLEEQASGISGLDSAQAVAASGDAKAEALIEESRTMAGDAGVDSTPAFLVGPTGGELELIAGADDLESAIDEALTQAES